MVVVAEDSTEAAGEAMTGAVAAGDLTGVAEDLTGVVAAEADVAVENTKLEGW
jgi:hypothetical protein